MVLTILFGFMDFLSMIAILLVHYDVLGWKKAFIFAMYLIFKGCYFIGDFASVLDIGIGILFILMFIGFHSTWLTWVAAFFLLQKALVSMKYS